MDSLLQGIPGVSVYLDDILITGKTEELHLQTLDKVLTKLESAGLRLKKEKCSFMNDSVTYLGHKIDAQGLRPIPDKIEAIKEAPSPKNVTQVKSYLRLLSYYSRFLPNQLHAVA